MTIRKNEFQSIADVIKPHIIRDYDSITSKVADAIARDLCNYFISNNSAFNKEKFLRACGVYR